MFTYRGISLTIENVLVYLRKSRSDDPLLSVEETLAKHEKILDEWTERHFGVAVPDTQKYREVASGETIQERPAIQRVMRMVEEPKYMAILAVDVQRLSRGDLEDAGRIMKLLRYTNTLVITPDMVFDLNDEYDRDRFKRELERGNDYLEYTKKIMNRGRLLSVSQGNYIGNVAPYGYDKDWVMDGKRKCPTLKINPEQAEVVRMIFDMYVTQDMGAHNICHALDAFGIKPPRGEHWSPYSIRTILTNIHYLGKVKWYNRKTVNVVENGEIRQTRPRTNADDVLIYDGKHPAIITEDMFNAAREKMGRNHRTKSTTKVRNPLASLLFCQCGRAMSLRTYTSHNGAPRLLCDGQVHCGTGSCLYDEIIERVIVSLEQSIADFEIKLNSDGNEADKLHEKMVKGLEKRLKDLEAKEVSMWESQAHPDPEQRMPQHIFKQLNDKLLAEKEEVKKALQKAYETMPTPIDYEEKILLFKDALDALKNPNVDAQTKNTLLKRCIERIEYNRAKPERTKSQLEMYYDKERKRTFTRSPLKVGGNWTSPQIELDIKLRV